LNKSATREINQQATDVAIQASDISEEDSSLEEVDLGYDQDMDDINELEELHYTVKQYASLNKKWCLLAVRGYRVEGSSQWLKPVPDGNSENC
jgi:hypothetical protein